MAQHGLTLAHLQAADCFTVTPRTLTPGAVCYRNAQGQETAPKRGQTTGPLLRGQRGT